MQQQDDLNSNIALYQEASGKFDATTMAKKYSGRFDITHAPGHKASYGLAFSADRESKVQIFGGTNDNTGSIQSIFLGSGRTKGKEKKYVTIFNIYAPTAPTHTPENLVRYHAWLSELVTEVHKAKAAGCAVYIIGDFNVAPDPTMDRNLTGKTPTPNSAETLLWMQITSSLQMADAFRARHPNTTAMTHVRKDDQSRIDHVLCNKEDFKLIKGIAIDTNQKIPNTSHCTIILDLHAKLISATPKPVTKEAKSYSFHTTKGFTQVEWEALHEIQKQHAEEFKQLVARATNPQPQADQNTDPTQTQNQTKEQIRNHNTQWFKDYTSLISKTIDEHNVVDTVNEHIKTRTQKQNCGRAYWSMAYNKTAKTLQALKNTMDLLITWKHQAKIRPLLQRITADIPKQTIPLTHSMKTEKDSTELYDRLKAIKKEIAAPLQKRTREKQYNITKTNKELTQTVDPSGV